MSKFNLKAKTDIEPTNTPDAWIHQEKKPTKRLTVDIDAELHKRYKMWCTEHNCNMVELIRDFIEAKVEEV